MLTAADIFEALTQGLPVPGRHIVVSAHPDDETISFAGALPQIADVQIVQLTDAAPPCLDHADRVAGRYRERAEAVRVLGVTSPIIDCQIPGRQSWRQPHLLAAVARVHDVCIGADVVWTHPYEGGHIDHDSAAWIVQTACAQCEASPARMEFASYHSHAGRRSTFGAFWPDPNVPHRAVSLGEESLALKTAAMGAYASQAHILKKFPTCHVEHYRVAPVYDFGKPSPPPYSRWDSRGYQPTTAMWRLSVADAARQLREVAA